MKATSFLDGEMGKSGTPPETRVGGGGDRQLADRHLDLREKPSFRRPAWQCIWELAVFKKLVG